MNSLQELTTNESSSSVIPRSEIVKVFNGPRSDTKLIEKVLNYLVINNGSIHAACTKFNLPRSSVELWVSTFNSNADSAYRIAKRKHNMLKYDDAFRATVVSAYQDGAAVSAISKKYGVHIATIYNWLRAANARESDTDSKKSDDRAALLARVIDDIKNGRTTEQSRSLSADFGVTTVNDKPAANTELNFCPCCGTNIKAVRVALETVQELSH
jgi:transposase-like protein